MSRNGSGTYTLPAGNPVVTGTTIASTWANNTMNDLASAMTDSVAADGQTAMTGNLNLNSNKIVNLATPTLSTDAVTKAYADALVGGAGSFTTLTSSGATTFTANTASTSTTTGTAVITGGLGVSGRINAANFDGIVGANTAAAGKFTTLEATGVTTVQAGTVSAPAITTTGDTNTGIFFPAADTIAFAEGGAESMRIDSNGDAMIGTTSANGKVTINQTDINARTITASSPASYAATAFRSDSAATSGTGWYHLYGSSSGGSVNNIFIYGNGNIENANNSYGAISDIKVKENIVDATPKLDKLMQVKVRNYNLKGEYDQHKQIGVIAQELETIFPSLIEETQDRGLGDELLGTTTKSVKYSVFVPMLIKALQELNAKVGAQAVRIAELERAK